MSLNDQLCSPLTFRVLTDSQISDIYEVVLKILNEVGAEIFHQEILDLLREAGAKVEDNTVYFPNKLVEDGVASAPNGCNIYDRDGNQVMDLRGTNSFFGNGSDCPHILDHQTGERRKATVDDVEKIALVCDNLSNFDFVMPGAIPSDVPANVADIYQFKATISNTNKPVVFTSLSYEGTETIIEMAKIAAGGRTELDNKPFIIPYIEPTSPLQVSREAAEKLLLCGNKGIPILFAPGPISGASAPITMAGTMALHIAENLIGLVIVQLIREGAPVVIGGCSSEMDMKTTISPYSGPTFNLVNGGISDICNYLDLPMFGTAGSSDSKLVDEQATMEGAISSISQLLSGANLIHDVGYLESGMTNSLEMLVIENEVIDMARAIQRGVKVDPQHLAFDVIQDVGPGGNYLSHKHTLDHFKNEHWEPELSNRQNFRSWVNDGKPTLKSVARDRVNTILDGSEANSLEPHKASKIEDLLETKSRSKAR
ncbi:trimethylamine methyltransferase family protein [Candidatus Bipolaricaulota bacterium]|nr:trimethylamine methyltransferase family protein [Candidatus Bipolaricaulota bacterium]